MSRALSLALITDYNLLHIIPELKFPQTGNITKITFSGEFLDPTVSNTRQYYPELQVWRLQNGTSDTYVKVGAVGYVTPPTFSQWVNVYEYTMKTSLSVQEGDVFGYYQPPSVTISCMGRTQTVFCYRALQWECICELLSSTLNTVSPIRTYQNTI